MSHLAAIPFLQSLQKCNSKETPISMLQAEKITGTAWLYLFTIKKKVLYLYLRLEQNIKKWLEIAGIPGHGGTLL